MKIAKDETLLIGRWVIGNDRIVADETSVRIGDLIRTSLQLLGNDESGWLSLYRDPEDGRLWELSYPDGGGHGGGAPQLRLLTSVEASARYPNIRTPKP